jgi:hypothetical protein
MSVLRSVTRASNKGRTKALFSSASDDTVASSLFFSLPTGVLTTERLGNNIPDATRRGGAHGPEDYSAECVEGEFQEVRLYGVLRSSL